MTGPRRAPMWAGRILAFTAILLMALNLRTAVAAVSPIAAVIDRDINLESIALGLLGAMPAIAFAVCGIAAPIVARRMGLEAALVVASAAMVAGHLIRTVSGSYLVLLLGSALVLAGMGFGNILLPPVVKKYFPDRIGLVTTSYATLLSISTAAPALLAAPIADAAGWRVSLGVWAVLALGAFIPWLGLALKRRRDARRASEFEEPALAAVPLSGPLWRSPVAWAITIAFAVSSTTAYAFFAWLPEILMDLASVTAVEAGALLALFAIMGLPASLLIPGLAVRMKNVGWLIQFGVACFLAGFGGLLLFPGAATWAWVVLLGLGPLLFPVCLVLINSRTRSPEASISLSGFVQGIGYTLGALGPLVVGLLHDATGGWTVPLVALMATTVAGSVAGIMLAKPRFVEDDLADRTARRQGTSSAR